MTETTRTSLELLFNISREISSALDLHTVLTRVLALSTSSVQAERGSVVIIDEQRRPVDAAIIYEGRLSPHTVEQMKSTLEQGLAGWVVSQRQGALVANTSQDARWLRRPDDEKAGSGPKSAICAPIVAREELVGVLTMVHARPGFFDKDHLALLQAIADQAGIAIHNARLYESLQAAHQRYQELFEDSIDPILVTSLEGKIQDANRQAAAVSGRAREALQGTPIWELYRGGSGWLEENIAAIEGGETVSCEAEFTPLNRLAVPVEIYVHKIHFGDGELLQWIIRDISERKQLDLLRDDLSAMIYHDLRSPLANIVSSLDMLRSIVPEETSDEQNPMVAQIMSIAIRSSERMQRLINSLLDINRLEAGQSIVNRKAVEILPLIREALDAVQPITSTKRQKVVIEAEDTLPAMWVDEDMIRRVLINLLENATKFTPVEGSLEVRASGDKEWVKVWVKDTGPGIPSEAQATIFDKFSRIQMERMQGERMPRGLGLGLAFCKMAVQAHGGSIGVESELGAGSSFFFNVPAARDG
jgi:PAS domain S-box-containing protein